MKTKLISILLGLFVNGLAVYAQNTIYRMHVKMQDGSTYTVKTNDVKEIYFTASQPYDPSNPVTADITSIHAPQEGGTYSVHITTPIPLTTEGGTIDIISTENGFTSFLNRSTVSLSKEYDDGLLTIIVNPATSYIVNNTTVKLYDYEGTEAFSIIISQDGNPNTSIISYNGKNYISTMAKLSALSHSNYMTADAKYTGLIENNDFKAPIDPYNYQLRELWNNLWQGISRNTQLMENCNSNGMEIFLPMCYVLNTLSYYELVTLFGGVPYYTNVNESTNYLPRTDPGVMFSHLTTLLTSVISSMDEKVTGYIDSPEAMLSPSRDIIRVLLADLYMYQGDYAKAKVLLDEIVSSGRYSLVSTQKGIDGNSAEIIWSQPAYSQTTTRANVTFDVDLGGTSNYCIVKTYADVFLSLAECESKTGNEAKAKDYLNQVATTKGIQITSDDVIMRISEIRRVIQVDFGGYFAFLKRNGIAQSTLGLEEYQLLFPIPQDQVNMNPALTQNPGYDSTTR